MNKKTDKHKRRNLFATKIDLPLLDIFNSKKKNMVLIRGIYFLWRLETENISMKNLSIEEIRSIANIKYSINIFLSKYKKKNPAAIYYRNKVESIFPFMSKIEAKDILLKHLENIEDELLTQAIIKLTE